MIKTTILCTILFAPVLCFADGTDQPAPTSVPPSGLRSNVTVGAVDSASTRAGWGTSESALLAYGSMHGRLSIDVGVELETQRYSGVVSAVEYRVANYAGRPTVGVEYFGDRWVPHASIGVGYMFVTASGAVQGMSASTSDNLLAIAASAGVDYRLSDRVALGAYVRYEPCLEPALNQYVDVGLGLSAH